VALATQVEIMLAAGDLQAAAAAAHELGETAAVRSTPLLRALSEHARGSVLLAQRSARDALAALREAWTLWQQLDAPYESARSRVLIGLACRQLEDHDTAQLHLEAAASVFERLGAATDLSALAQLMSAPTGPAVSSPLTDRELDVLKRVACGGSNRQIAAALGISEHTVARHLANIFNKLGVASRTAASAYAFEHDLL
jgi:DNA-binding NarL/FixJ family response regulator